LGSVGQSRRAEQSVQGEKLESASWIEGIGRFSNSLKIVNIYSTCQESNTIDKYVKVTLSTAPHEICGIAQRAVEKIKNE